MPCSTPWAMPAGIMAPTSSRNTLEGDATPRDRLAAANAAWAAEMAAEVMRLLPPRTPEAIP